MPAVGAVNPDVPSPSHSPVQVNTICEWTNRIINVSILVLLEDGSISGFINLETCKADEWFWWLAACIKGCQAYRGSNNTN
jgi:hypothetical protein